jgi:hypothetical protein
MFYGAKILIFGHGFHPHLVFCLCVLLPDLEYFLLNSQSVFFAQSDRWSTRFFGFIATTGFLSCSYSFFALKFVFGPAACIYFRFVLHSAAADQVWAPDLIFLSVFSCEIRPPRFEPVGLVLVQARRPQLFVLCGAYQSVLSYSVVPLIILFLTAGFSFPLMSHGLRQGCSFSRLMRCPTRSALDCIFSSCFLIPVSSIQVHSQIGFPVSFST